MLFVQPTLLLFASNAATVFETGVNGVPISSIKNGRKIRKKSTRFRTRVFYRSRPSSDAAAVIRENDAPNACAHYHQNVISPRPRRKRARGGGESRSTGIITKKNIKSCFRFAVIRGIIHAAYGYQLRRLITVLIVILIHYK